MPSRPNPETLSIYTRILSRESAPVPFCRAVALELFRELLLMSHEGLLSLFVLSTNSEGGSSSFDSSFHFFYSRSCWLSASSMSLTSMSRICLRSSRMAPLSRFSTPREPVSSNHSPAYSFCYLPVSASGSRPGTPDDRTGTPPARITRTGPLGAQEAVSAVSSVTTTCGSGGNRYGGLVYYYIPHRGTHREHRGNAIAALLCGSLVACRPPGDLKNTTNPH